MCAHTYTHTPENLTSDLPEATSCKRKFLGKPGICVMSSIRVCIDHGTHGLVQLIRAQCSLVSFCLKVSLFGPGLEEYTVT